MDAQQFGRRRRKRMNFCIAGMRLKVISRAALDCEQKVMAASYGSDMAICVDCNGPLARHGLDLIRNVG